MSPLLSLLVNILIYLGVGCLEWYLALRRTLACARGETAILVSITFVENLLGLWVLSTFISKNDWLIAIAYSTGGAIGAWIVAKRMRKDDGTGQC